MLSKTVNGETTMFEYNDASWPDLMTAINGVPLYHQELFSAYNMDDEDDYVLWCYDYSGNLEACYIGNDDYCEFQYDCNGIRTQKSGNAGTVNYETLNGVILSQNDGTNTICFHYNDNMPVGFTLNDTKYIYLTNLQGDVVGIADTQGNVLARYSYDEWGKLLSITANSDDNYALAELNPLRYRGYYYDNETGYYYLQSRYYNPEWGRFISYDDPEYASADTPASSNLFVYCINNPLRYTDPSGKSATQAINSILYYIIELLIGIIGDLGNLLFEVSFIAIILTSIYIAIDSDVKKYSSTRIQKDVKSKRIGGQKEYQICYVSDNNILVKVGNKLTWSGVLAALGINETTVNYNITRSINLKYANNNVINAKNSSSCWGIYADSQEAAKTLAFALGGYSPPEVHNSGYYAHYHDGQHKIHIWYGSKIWY